MSAFRHPVVPVSHGPGALWLLSTSIAGMSKNSVSAQTLKTLFEKLYPNDENLPKRILVVSAHFEAVSGGFEISKAAKPEMIYDYYGLPDEAYDVVCPAKGDPEFAVKLEEVLAQNNIKVKLVNHGFDHGVFVPMLLIRPQSDIPVVSMSINSRLDSNAHFNLVEDPGTFP